MTGSWRRALARLTNRVVAAILRSRWHRMFSGSLALLTVTHRTGRPMTFPVMYAADGATVVVYVGNASRKTWWRSIGRGGDPVRIRLAGRELTGMATVHAGRRDPTGTAAILQAWLRRFPGAASRLGAGRIRRGRATPRQIAALAADAVLVRIQLADVPPATPALTISRWTAACVAGELIGIGTAAAVLTNLSSPIWAWLGAIGAGTVEGFALGGLQWLALRRKLAALPARRWVGATVALAVTGWAAGMLPSTLAGEDTGGSAGTAPAAWLLALLAVAGGLAGGAAVGAVQAWAMRGYATGRRGWVAVNAAGWALALCWIFLFAALPAADWPWWTIAGSGLLAGAASGITVGVVTGMWLPRLRPAAPAGDGSQVGNARRSGARGRA
jgi:hypothetical protein